MGHFLNTLFFSTLMLFATNASAQSRCEATVTSERITDVLVAAEKKISKEEKEVLEAGKEAVRLSEELTGLKNTEARKLLKWLERMERFRSWLTSMDPSSRSHHRGVEYHQRRNLERLLFQGKSRETADKIRRVVYLVEVSFARWKLQEGRIQEMLKALEVQKEKGFEAEAAKTKAEIQRAEEMQSQHAERVGKYYSRYTGYKNVLDSALIQREGETPTQKRIRQTAEYVDKLIGIQNYGQWFKPHEVAEFHIQKVEVQEVRKFFMQNVDAFKAHLRHVLKSQGWWTMTVLSRVAGEVTLGTISDAVASNKYPRLAKILSMVSRISKDNVLRARFADQVDDLVRLRELGATPNEIHAQMIKSWENTRKAQFTEFLVRYGEARDVADMLFNFISENALRQAEAQASYNQKMKEFGFELKEETPVGSFISDRKLFIEAYKIAERTDRDLSYHPGSKLVSRTKLFTTVALSGSYWYIKTQHPELYQKGLDLIYAPEVIEFLGMMTQQAASSAQGLF